MPWRCCRSRTTGLTRVHSASREAREPATPGWWPLMIRMVNLEKRYGRLVAVKNLNLHIAPGEFFGFLGPNGAGKTTTIKMLVGLLKPSAGSATIAGYDIQRTP